MRHILFLPDLHITNNGYSCRLDNVTQTIMDKLTHIYNYAKQRNAIIISPGDFCDVPRSWPLLTNLVSFLSKYAVPTYFVYGQHDMYMRTCQNTTASILVSLGLLRQLSTVPVELNEYRLYGCGFEQEMPVSVIKDNKLNIFVTHKKIYEYDTYGKNDTDKITADSFLNQNKHNYTFILCGDSHQYIYKKEDNTRLLNAGCLIRNTTKLYDAIPGFFYWDGRAISWEVVPYKPAREVISLANKTVDDVSNTSLFDKFLNVCTKRDNQTEKCSKKLFVRKIFKFIEDNNITDSVVDILSSIMESTDNG